MPVLYSYIVVRDVLAAVYIWKQLSIEVCFSKLFSKSLSLSLFFLFVGLHPWHMEVPSLGVELDLSYVCDLHHSSLQRGIFNPLKRPGMEPASSVSPVGFKGSLPLSQMGNSSKSLLNELLWHMENL